MLTLSHLQSWQRCQKQYYYKHHLGYQWPREEGRFVLGKAVHKLLEYQARGLATDHLLDKVDPPITSYTRLLSAHPLGQAPIVASEWAFHLPVAGADGGLVWWTGRVDRIVRFKAGRIGILDWKTGTAIPKNPQAAWQTRLYLAAVWTLRDRLKLGIKTPDQLVFVYAGVKGPQVQCVEVPYALDHYTATLAELAVVSAELADPLAFALPVRCPDSFCPYGGICGIGAPAEGDPSSPVPAEGLSLPADLDGLF